MSAFLFALLWAAPYLVSGFSAPLIFKLAPTPITGGHYAGALFMFAGAWALFLSFRHEYPLWAKILFAAFLCLEGLFWTWRFRITTPLRESLLLGINGGAWHGIMTLLYVSLAILLVSLEFQRLRVFLTASSQY